MNSHNVTQQLNLAHTISGRQTRSEEECERKEEGKEQEGVNMRPGCSHGTAAVFLRAGLHADQERTSGT